MLGTVEGGSSLAPTGKESSSDEHSGVNADAGRVKTVWPSDDAGMESGVAGQVVRRYRIKEHVMLNIPNNDS